MHVHLSSFTNTRCTRCDIAAQDNEGRTPLFAAIAEHDAKKKPLYKVVKLLCEVRRCVDSTVSVRGYHYGTALENG